MLNMFRKKKRDVTYILIITMEKPCAERTVDLHLRYETYFSNFICRQDNQTSSVLTYEVLPKADNTEFVHSLLTINSVVMVSINRK